MIDPLHISIGLVGLILGGLIGAILAMMYGHKRVREFKKRMNLD
jgi:uncharacterized membrane protein YsdA (DUF1294 family)